MRTIIEDSLKKAMSYDDYMTLMQHLVKTNSTTGTDITSSLIEYTKLNTSRMKRLNKTITLSSDQCSQLKTNNTQTWLLISEAWCGDAAQSLPIIHKIAEQQPHVTFKIVLRDENPELMDKFLTNGSRSIPLLIILDDNLNVVKTWGPRSTKATQLVTDYKTKNGALDAEFKKSLQVWYNNDKGQSIIEDFKALI